MNTLLTAIALGLAQTSSMPKLVDVEWVKSHAQTLMIDARDLKSYLEKHPAGSVFVNPESLRYSRGGVPARLHEPPVLSRMFGEMGIGRGTTVVVFSSASDDFASSTFVATLLEAAGHANVAVMDGGYEGWAAAGAMANSDLASVRPTSFPGFRWSDLVVEGAYVRANAAKLNLLDARPPAVYTAGHIPGAMNLPLKSLLTDGSPVRWKTPETLRSELQATGIDPAKPIVTYCTTGREASMLYYTLKHIAKVPNVRVYLGSMLDWKSRGFPVEK